jgi:regulator of protease activity HflC (stomatin/prohibitin superfamily)
MQNATMLYRSPGSETIWGVSVDTLIVDASEVPEKLAAGWHLSVHDADQAEKDRLAAQLKANEDEQARIAAELAAQERERIRAEILAEQAEQPAAPAPTAAPASAKRAK